LVSRLAVVSIGLLAIALYWGSELYLLSGASGFALDDSWIHLQFARNLADGAGLAYNPGELVTGSTAPLWTGLISVFTLLPGNPVVWIKLFGAALFLLSLIELLRLAELLTLSRGLSMLVVTLTALTAWLLWSALSGLEIPLFVLLSITGVRLHVQERLNPERAPLSLAILAISVLARPEGFLLLAAGVLDRLLQWRRDAEGGLILGRLAVGDVLRGLAWAMVIILPTLLVFSWIGGSVLPTTFGAKSSGVRSLLPNARYLYTILNIFFAPHALLALASLGGVLVMIERLGGDRDRGLLPALWFVGLPLAYSTMSPPGTPTLAGNFGRYYFPLFPFCILLGVIGLERALATLGPRLRVGILTIPLRSLLLLAVLWPTARDFVTGVGRYTQTVMNVEDSDVRMAHWLADRVPAEAVLGVNDIGALKYFLPNEVVDLAGIIHPEVQTYMAEAGAEGRDRREGVRRFLEERRPDYLVIFPNWFPELTQDGEAFRELYRMEIPANVTMGGDTLVVYSTPWTRFPGATARIAQGDGA